MLAGLEPLDGGAIHIGDRDVSNVRPRDRDIAMVFAASYALYPQLTVAENMGFALKQAKLPKEERITRVREARVLDLMPFLDRKPKALSGGQRQRVAMGRADRPQAVGLPHGRASPTSTRSCASRPAPRSSSCRTGSA